MPKKDKNLIKITRIEWISMHHIPKKMTTDIDTARELAKVFGDKIYNEITIIPKEVRKEDE